MSYSSTSHLGFATASRAGDSSEVLLLCPELFAAEGGIARISRLYLETLAEATRGRVRLVVLNDNELPPSRLARHTPDAGSAERISARAIACGRSKSRFLRAALAAAPTCPRALVTHVHLLPILLFARLRHPRLTWDVVLHGIEAWAPLPILAAAALRRARRVYCVSDYTRSSVAARHPTAADRLRVLPNAIDPVLADALAGIAPRAAEPGRILAVSRLAPHDHAKGIDHLIQALPAVRERVPCATLHIVGDGADRTRLQALADASPARDAIVFHGILPEDALLDQFARCRLFALPSDKEGFGLVYAEAMCAGRPSLAARAGGAPEVIGRDGGLLVPYGDVGAIAQACVEALQREWSDAILRARSKLFCVAQFRKNFTALWPDP